MPVTSDRSARIVVVCTANVIRSPFVAGLLRSRVDAASPGQVDITSAGVAARFGTVAEPRVRDVARTYGLDLDAHRASRLVEATLVGRTAILCAERRHRRAVLQMRPDLLSSVFTIREFARLLEAVRAAGSVPADWDWLVRAAAAAREQDRHITEDEDDIVDPIAQSDEVWRRFEQQSVQAVSSILASVQHLPGRAPLTQAARTASASPTTRREYRRILSGTGWS